jgi:predicted nuclease with TOPRIM domain
MQWGVNAASPVSSDDIITKLNQINNKLNSIQETKTDLLNSINNNNNSLANLNNHNARLRQFIQENSIASPGPSNS